MERCCHCAFYLPHRLDDYNCGYLIRRVEERSCICKYFEPLKD